LDFALIGDLMKLLRIIAVTVALVMGPCLESLAQNQQLPQTVQPNLLKNTKFVVKLLSPISTKTSQQSDTFTTSVEMPPEYTGAVFEGKITKLKKPKKGVGQGKPEIVFHFESITFQGRTTPVTADVTDVSNSKGVQSVDEEGQVIAKTSNKKRAAAAAAGAGLGALVGGLRGGTSGAAIGAAAGAGAGLIIGMTMTTTGSDMEFLPGSRFTLNVSGREH
jgi:hypothetical protein